MKRIGAALTGRRGRKPEPRETTGSKPVTVLAVAVDEGDAGSDGPT
jgi:hypothetical protein